MTARVHLGAWLEIMRISNAPTVVSNAIAGAVLGACALAAQTEQPKWIAVWFGNIAFPAGPRGVELPWHSATDAARFLAPFAIPLLAYLGGMVLNDAFDAEIDQRERPTRPIPSGRIGRRAAFVAGFTLLGTALVLAALRGPAMVFAATAVLVLAIVIYDRFHAKSVGSTLLLALCRALAALVPMLAFARGDIGLLFERGAIVLPVALAAWTLGLSLLARSEISLRDAETRREGDVAQPCPKCGQLLIDRHDTCGECGLPSTAPERRAIARERRVRLHRLRLVLPVIAVAAILAALFAAHRLLLHRDQWASDSLANPSPAAAIGAAVLCALTTVRAAALLRREPARTPDAIAMLIACLALVDAMALAVGGHWLPAFACVALFGLTRLAQRRIAGS